MCGEMEQRLGGVLRNEPEEASGKSEAQMTKVGVAERIDLISNRLHRVGNTWNSILRRLEL